MMRKLLSPLALVAIIISCSAINRSSIAGEISDMNSYLVQATCSGGLTPNNCAYAYQTKDLITTPLTFRRLDWPGAYSPQYPRCAGHGDAEWCHGARAARDARPHRAGSARGLVLVR